MINFLWLCGCFLKRFCHKDPLQSAICSIGEIDWIWLNCLLTDVKQSDFGRIWVRVNFSPIITNAFHRTRVKVTSDIKWFLRYRRNSSKQPLPRMPFNAWSKITQQQSASTTGKGRGWITRKKIWPTSCLKVPARTHPSWKSIIPKQSVLSSGSPGCPGAQALFLNSSLNHTRGVNTDQSSKYEQKFSISHSIVPLLSSPFQFVPNRVNSVSMSNWWHHDLTCLVWRSPKFFKKRNRNLNRCVSQGLLSNFNRTKVIIS